MAKLGVVTIGCGITTNYCPSTVLFEFLVEITKKCVRKGKGLLLLLLLGLKYLLFSTQTFFKISRAWPFAHMVKCPLKKGLFFKFFDFSNFKMFPTKTGMIWSWSFLVCNKYLPILVSINSIEMIRYNVTGLEGIKYCKNVKNRLKWHILAIYSKH